MTVIASYSSARNSLRTLIRQAKQFAPLCGLLCALLTGPFLHAEPIGNTGLDAGYHSMYNRDFDRAHSIFGEWINSHPADPMGPVSDAAAYLFSEFDRLGVLDIALFADDNSFEKRGKLTPDASLKTNFTRQIDAADHLADAALKSSPTDPSALFVKAMVFGLQSDYAALIEKKDLAAFNFTKAGSVFAQKTLAADPTRYDAYLSTGVENYLLGIKPAPVRWFLSIAGGQTNKDEGIRQLKLTADKGHYLAPFARLLLAVAAVRDKQPQQARSLLEALSSEYPNNPLYARQLARIN